MSNLPNEMRLSSGRTSLGNLAKNWEVMVTTKCNSLRAFSILITVLFLLSNEARACVVGQAASCVNSICSTHFTMTGEESTCKRYPPEFKTLLALPFAGGTPVYCFKGGQIPESTHAYDQSLFSMDLGSNYASPPAFVTAVESGYAVAIGGCANAAGTVSANGPDTCNEGFGNQVRVLHQGNFASHYAHLEKILVADGQFVKKGQVIGVEGYSGNAGSRHVHFDVHVIPAQNIVSALAQLHQKSPTQESVPYHFEVMTARGKTILNSYGTVCPEWGDFSVNPLYRTF